MPYGSAHVHTPACRGIIEVVDVPRWNVKKSICITAVFYLVAKTCTGLRAVWDTIGTCPWHFVPESKSILCAIQPECLCLNHSVHDNFSEVSGQFVRTNSRMSRHSHICSDMIILISNQILCSLLAIMYAVVSKHTSKDSGIFILFLVAI